MSTIELQQLLHLHEFFRRYSYQCNPKFSRLYATLLLDKKAQSTSSRPILQDDTNLRQTVALHE